MTCSKVLPLLSRLLDRELSPGETAEVKGHLARCEDCRGLLDHWRLQGSLLRSHLDRHALNEDFVRKVLNSDPVQKREAGRNQSQTTRRWNLFRWLPAAAAIVLGIMILGQLFPGKEGLGYARVIDPGESLEVMPSNSNAWIRTAVGELLHPGDWLRNPVAAAAEIMWRDACRVTLMEGALAHIPADSSGNANQLILHSGSLRSEIQTGKIDFAVRTPAGLVLGSGGVFSLRIGEITLPQIEVAADRTESRHGVIMPIGEVQVKAGNVKLETAYGNKDVIAGETADFSVAHFAGGVVQPGAVEAALEVVEKTSENGTLTSSLTATSKGLRVDLNVARVSLKMLLECATGVRVRGGENLTVSGSLRSSANSSPESVAAAVGKAIGATISVRTEIAQKSMASPRQYPTPAADWVQGSFTLEKSEDGLISFDFRAVPAGEAFRILRPVVLPDLPEIAPEAAWLPLTLHADLLSSAEVSAHLAKALDLQFENVNQSSSVIEIGSVGPMPPNSQDGITAAPPLSAPRAKIARDDRPAETTATAGTLYPPDGMTGTVPEMATEIRAIVAQRTDPGIGPVWSIFSGSIGLPTFPNVTPLAAANQSVLNGKSSPKKRDFFAAAAAPQAEPSVHLIWPVLGSESVAAIDAAYFITNAMGLAAHTIWSGFDRQGQLIAQYALVVAPSSTFSLLPPKDLPARIGDGGHWETISDLPLVGSRDGGTGEALEPGLPVTSEQLSGERAFPATWLSELGMRLWLVNPAEEHVKLVVAIRQGQKLLSAEQLTIPPHGGILWPDPTSATQQELSGRVSGLRVVVRSLSGYPVAAGLTK